MYRIAALTSVLSVLALSTVLAETDPRIANTFGNTVVVTAADGTVAKIHYRENGTFHNVDGTVGTWELQGDQFCVTPEGEETDCDPLTEEVYGVGDTYEYTDDEGETVTISIE